MNWTGIGMDKHPNLWLNYLCMSLFAHMLGMKMMSLALCCRAASLEI